MIKRTIVILAWSATASQAAPAVAVTPVSCQGSATVQATAEPAYTPPVIYNHPTRVLPLPALITFKAVLAVQSTSAGCAELADKYGLAFGTGTTLLAEVDASQGGYAETVDYWPHAATNPGPTPIFSAHLAQLAAAGAVGQTLTFAIDQTFAYAFNGTLPLFPLVHEETLTLTAPVAVDTQLGAVALTAAKAYAVNASAVYGIKPVDAQSDAEKLAATAKVAGLAITLGQQNGGELPEVFSQLLLHKLQPWSSSGMIQYKDVLASILAGVAQAQYPSDQYFDFGVGGAGGAQIAEKLVQLSNVPGVFASGEAASLLFEYPALALITGSDKCLAAGADALPALLTKALGNVAALTQPQKWTLSEVTDYIAAGYWNVTQCFPEATQPNVKGLAAALHQKL